MPTLSTLPDELLSDVVSVLEYDRENLEKLTRVSRRLYYVARRYLYRHVELTTVKDKHHDPLFEGEPASAVQESLLQRSLKSNEELRKFVKSYGPVQLVRHRWEIGPFESSNTPAGHVEQPKSCILTDKLQTLESLTNLRELWVKCVDGKDPIKDDNKEYVPFFISPLLDQLHTIYIEDVDSVEAVSSMILPKIRSLYCGRIISPRGQIPLKLPHATSSLRRLELGDGTEIPSPILGQLLSICPKLEVLKIHGMLNVSFWAWPPLEYTFSAEGFMDALSHVQSTLKALDIVIPDKNVIRAEGAPIDLSKFYALTDLRISGLYFFKCEEPRPSRLDLYQLLPPNLESLQIDFAPVAGVFHNFWTDHSLSEASRSKLYIPPERYNYVRQFPVHKESHFPKLRKVVLVDDERPQVPGPERELVTWKQPMSVKKMFEEKMISLQVEILSWGKGYRRTWRELEQE